MRDYQSSDAFILENYILDPEFDGSRLTNPANPGNAFKMLIKEIEIALSIPVKSGVAPQESKKERKGRLEKGRETAEKPSMHRRLGREKLSACIIVPVDIALSPLELAFVRLGPRLAETKLCYTLDGKPCNTVDIFRAAGLPA